MLFGLYDRMGDMPVKILIDGEFKEVTDMLPVTLLDAVDEPLDEEIILMMFARPRCVEE